jgi:hypothetical protein
VVAVLGDVVLYDVGDTDLMGITWAGSLRSGALAEPVFEVCLGRVTIGGRNARRSPFAAASFGPTDVVDGVFPSLLSDGDEMGAGIWSGHLRAASKKFSTSLLRYIHFPATRVPTRWPASRSDRIDRALIRFPPGSSNRATSVSL